MIVRIANTLPRRLASRIGSLFDGDAVTLLEFPAGPGLVAALERESVDLVLVEGKVVGGRRSTTLESLRATADHPDIIVFVPREDPELRARLLAEGALAVIFQDLPDASIREAMAALLARRRQEIRRKLAADHPDMVSSLSDFSTRSEAMRQFLAMVSRVVSADSSLLILGETGVGKEHLARSIHNEGKSDGPFIAVNCGAFPETLLESELFGHVAGAFTGAVRARRGYFELAHGGTLFLDEIGELPLHLQVKLLRVLQERCVQPLGSERSQSVDVRLMAATNRDLLREIHQGRFRSDLYYRLAVVTLNVPPLRERQEDIAPLAADYVRHYQVRLQRPVLGISEEALEQLVGYSWPGNVRELINVIERAVLLCGGAEIVPEDLPLELRVRAPEGEDARTGALELPELLPATDWKPWREARQEILDRFEHTYLTEALRRSGGRIGEAAQRAGISSRLLHRKMRDLGLKKEDFKFAPATPPPKRRRKPEPA